jgi:hypothetical protein
VARGRGEIQFVREVTAQHSNRTALVSWVPHEPTGPEQLQQLFQIATIR